jgi:hypothetical protein
MVTELSGIASQPLSNGDVMTMAFHICSRSNICCNRHNSICGPCMFVNNKVDFFNAHTCGVPSRCGACEARQWAWAVKKAPERDPDSRSSKLTWGKLACYR